MHLDAKNITTVNFFSNCVRYNKPCRLKGLASNWTALEKWKEENNGYKYIGDMFGDSNIGVYTQAANLDNVEVRKYSFRNDMFENLTYSDFI